jgi:poly(3-hydroxybutyrate) depolymerase
LVVFYDLHERNRVLLAAAAQAAEVGARMFSAPESWLSYLPGASGVAAGYQLLHRLGKGYEKPSFGIRVVSVDGAEVQVAEEAVVTEPFCRLLHFRRSSEDAGVATKLKQQPVVLVVAPLSGHHATLLRDTVRTLLCRHDVYVTDWTDAREVPAEEGPFTLADYVGYVRAFIRTLGASRLHVIAVSQPSVPVLAATALMAAAGEPEPRSLILMGGSVDARQSPTAVTDFAANRSLGWFESNVLFEVPPSFPGRGRRVYPGFLQHAGFMALNPVRHLGSHWDFYLHLVEGDLEGAEQHRRFYDEYNAVLDLPAEYYLDCIRIVFQQHLLPRGLWHVAGERVAPEAISRAALLTVEGELDDISGIGQTKAAHALTPNIPGARHVHWEQPRVGHYGIFNGRKWREQIMPRVRDFIRANDA